MSNDFRKTEANMKIVAELESVGCKTGFVDIVDNDLRKSIKDTIESRKSLKRYQYPSKGVYSREYDYRSR